MGRARQVLLAPTFALTERVKKYILFFSRFTSIESVFSCGKGSPLREMGPRSEDERRCCGLSLLQGGLRASSRPTAASFPEQEEGGAEKLPPSQAGGFPAVPTPPSPHPCTVSSAMPLPDQRGTHLFLPPWAGNLKGEQSPTPLAAPLLREMGEGEAPEPLPRPRPAPRD